MENEIWKPVVGYEGLYEVSNTGNVKSLGNKVWKNARILKPQVRGKSGYLFVRLSKDGQAKGINIHRLVAETFIPNPLNLPIVNHKDENRTNNHVDNLEWCTVSYNSKYSMKLHPERGMDCYKKCFIDKDGKMKSSFSVKGNPHKNKQRVAMVNELWEPIRYYDNPSIAAKEVGSPVGNLVTTCKKNIERKYKHKTVGKIFIFAED